ncbi:MAG: dTDP-4-dehydrorhamnose 3,5-epimerase [Crocinitomicaceae bacterium]
MNFTECELKGLFILEPKVFGDERGYFYESFNQQEFNEKIGKEYLFVQDNQSLSSKNVVRGLHFQKPPFDQGKLVRVVQGSVLDVALDIRKDSPTYGKHFSILLSAENKKQFWVPPGFAHGFATLEDQTIFQYKCTNFYQPSSEDCVLWNDSDLNIDWQLEQTLVSEKDKLGKKWTDFSTPF